MQFCRVSCLLLSCCCCCYCLPASSKPFPWEAVRLLTAQLPHSASYQIAAPAPTSACPSQTWFILCWKPQCIPGTPTQSCKDIGYIQLWGDVWGCEGYKGEDEFFKKYFHWDNDVNFITLLTFTIVCLKKLQIPMKNYRWGVKKLCAPKWRFWSRMRQTDSVEIIQIIFQWNK